jgi:hypothetical protein
MEGKYIIKTQDIKIKTLPAEKSVSTARNASASLFPASAARSHEFVKRVLAAR